MLSALPEYTLLSGMGLVHGVHALCPCDAYVPKGHGVHKPSALLLYDCAIHT